MKLPTVSFPKFLSLARHQHSFTRCAKTWLLATTLGRTCRAAVLADNATLQAFKNRSRGGIAVGASCAPVICSINCMKLSLKLSKALFGFAVVFFTSGFVIAQETANTKISEPTWHDPSPHKVQFVTVERDVRLEVLDWGGTGRNVVLLAGLGNTAHIYDDLAPALAARFHVYGVTRRGYRESSTPLTGYSAERLGQDVIAVLAALKIDSPVLVGHSIAGEELSSVVSQDSKRIAGLVCLDAAYSYAF